MKIATFNINNINKRLNNLTDWLKRAQPDVVCLQELKAEQRVFPANTFRDLGYWRSLGWRTLLEWRGDSDTGLRPGADTIHLAWESRGQPGALYRSCGRWK